MVGDVWRGERETGSLHYWSCCGMGFTAAAEADSVSDLEDPVCQGHPAPLWGPLGLGMWHKVHQQMQKVNQMNPLLTSSKSMR